MLAIDFLSAFLDSIVPREYINETGARLYFALFLATYPIDETLSVRLCANPQVPHQRPRAKKADAYPLPEASPEIPGLQFFLVLD